MTGRAAADAGAVGGWGSRGGGGVGGSGTDGGGAGASGTALAAAVLDVPGSSILAAARLGPPKTARTCECKRRTYGHAREVVP